MVTFSVPLTWLRADHRRLRSKYRGRLSSKEGSLILSGVLGLDDRPTAPDERPHWRYPAFHDYTYQGVNPQLKNPDLIFGASMTAAATGPSAPTPAATGPPAPTTAGTASATAGAPGAGGADARGSASGSRT